MVLVRKCTLCFNTQDECTAYRGFVGLWKRKQYIIFLKEFNNNKHFQNWFPCLIKNLFSSAIPSSYLLSTLCHIIPSEPVNVTMKPSVMSLAIKDDKYIIMEK